ncbi:MAG: dihydroneopterin aldolase [Patiriisocius sp.]|jgi:dihydroneopterin aldolase
MGVIKVVGIKSHSFHGCMEEEAKIGADYEVDVELETDFLAAAKEDDLSKTVDYVQVNLIVEEEMAKRSKLIETVGYRITCRIIEEIIIVSKVTAEVKKINPPINGIVDYVSIKVTSERK